MLVGNLRQPLVFWCSGITPAYCEGAIGIEGLVVWQVLRRGGIRLGRFGMLHVYGWRVCSIWKFAKRLSSYSLLAAVAVLIGHCTIVEGVQVRS